MTLFAIIGWVIAGLAIALYFWSRFCRKALIRALRDAMEVSHAMAQELSRAKSDLDHHRDVVEVLVSNIRSGKRGIEELQSFIDGEIDSLRKRELKNRLRNSQN